MAPTLGKLLYDDSDTESARLYKTSVKRKLVASEVFIVGVWLFLLSWWWMHYNTVSTSLSNLLAILLLISICAFMILGIIVLLFRYWEAVAPMQVFENALVLGKDKEVYFFSDLEIIYWNPLLGYVIGMPKKDIKQRPFIIDKDLIYEKDKFKSILRERVHFNEEKNFTVKKALRKRREKRIDKTD